MRGRRGTGPRGWAWTLALAAVAACGSPTSVEIAQLQGRWDWRMASGGIAGRTITPATEGYTLELRVLDDDDVELYRNGALQSTAKYQLAIGSEGGSFGGKDVVRFAPALFGWDEMGLQLSIEGELVLADGCCDGYTYMWARAGSAR